MATQLAERSANPVEVFRQTLTQPAFIEQLKMALPSHIPVERFIRVAQTAVQTNPSLLDPQKVERRSLFGALTRAAQDGLMPDGHEGVIVPYKGKAMWQPMVAGFMIKVRRSGEIGNWEVAAVFEKDTFERLLGDDQRIYHKPYEDGDPGQVIGAYSIVTFKDGTKSRDYMPRWRIEKARQQGTARDSLMWSTFYDEGAIKTVIKHHSKRLPMSTDLVGILDRDDFMQHAGPAPAPVALVSEPSPQLSRLGAIEHQIETPEEPEVITEQAEELEAEIVEEKPRGRKNAQPEAAAATTMADQLGLDDPTQRIKDDLETAAQAGDGAAVERLIAAAEARTDLTGEQRVALEIAFSKARGKIGEVVS